MGPAAGRLLKWGMRRAASWPRRRLHAWVLMLVFVCGGILSARLDGFAVADLPFGRQFADGISPVGSSLPEIADNRTRPADTARSSIQTDAAAPLPSPLVIATEGDYPPFNFVDETGELRGLEVDFIHEVCATLRLTCKLVQRDWAELLPGLAAHDYDVVAASLRIPASPPPGIAFSRAYFRSAAAYATRVDDAGGRVTGPIGVEAGTRMAAYLAQRSDAVPIRTYDDPITSYKALADGQVNAVFDDAVRLNRWLHDPSSACCAMAGAAVFAPAYFGPGVGFAVRNSDTVLLAALNGVIVELSNDGKIAELSDRYLPFALN